MSCLMGIRGSSSSYDIYPIEEREEEQEEFVPYARQNTRPGLRIGQSLDFKRVGNSLSQSLDCKLKQTLKARRCKTIHKDDQRALAQLNSLIIGSSTLLHPLVIHSYKRTDSQPDRPDPQDAKKGRLERLQAEMRKHRPVFFKERAQVLAGIEEKPVRVLHLDAVKSNAFLFELRRRSREQLPTDKISGKELKKLIRIQKMQSWECPLPPKPRYGQHRLPQ